MRPLELLVVYLVIGAGVAFAWQRRHDEGRLWVLPLWPLFVPALLAEAGEGARPAPEPAPVEGWEARIEHAIAVLRGALGAWDALPDKALCEASLDAAARGLRALALRHAQLDGVLDVPENDLDKLEAERDAAPEAARPLVEARLRNVMRLVALRDGARDELEKALAGMADLSTRVHLARFTGDATQEVAAQLARLAHAVDGASEVTRLGA